ncbi:MAG TPA: hypothetical protein PK857_05505 [Hyphomicrobium sp.]|nr:hypothetical protein [Hyphomicrobium sp.]
MTVASSALPAPHLMPLMRYRDLAEAMSWLERAFGFEKQIAVSDNDGAAIYGQMTYRGSLLMMGAVRDTDLDKLMRQPDEVGDVETQSCYVVVDDADAHYARAVDAGAEIVLEITSDGLGRRGYSCRDPQGHIWNFGTYNPAKGLAPVAVAEAEPEELSPAMPSAAPRVRGALAAAVLLLATGAGAWLFSDVIKADLAQRFAQEQAAEAEAAYAELAKVRAEKRAADAKVAELSQRLETTRAEPSADTGAALQAEQARAQRAEAETTEARQTLGAANKARLDAEAEIAALKAELDRERAASKAASAQRQSDEAQAEQAGLAAKRLQEDLAATRNARLKAEAEAVTLKAELERQQMALDAANEAKRISEEKLAVQTAAAEALATKMARAVGPRAKAVLPPAASSAVDAVAHNATPTPTPPPAGSQHIETSATGPATPEADAPDKAKSMTRAPVATKRAARRNSFRRTAAARAEPQPPPTYVVNLRDVPWPYSAWYK